MTAPRPRRRSVPPTPPDSSRTRGSSWDRERAALELAAGQATSASDVVRSVARPPCVRWRDRGRESVRCNKAARRGVLLTATTRGGRCAWRRSAQLWNGGSRWSRPSRCRAGPGIHPTSASSLFSRSAVAFNERPRPCPPAERRFFQAPLDAWRASRSRRGREACASSFFPGPPLPSRPCSVPGSCSSSRGAHRRRQRRAHLGAIRLRRCVRLRAPFGPR